MYCGRELAKGEVCGCPQSVKMRREKEQKESGGADTRQSADYASNTSAQPEDKTTWRQRREKKRRTRPVRNKTQKTAGTGGARGFFSYILSCVREPVFKAANPGYVRMWWIWALTGINGFTVSAALFLSGNALKKGLFGIISMVLGFKGVAGWRNILQLLLAAVSGTVMGYIQFFVLCAVFFIIGKLAVRSASGFKEYMERFAPCTIPLTAVGLLGIVFAVFSPSMLMLLLACGAVFEAILLYEALRSHWHTQPDFTIYTAAGGLFVYAVLCFNIYKLFIM